MKKEPSALRS